MSIQFPKFFCFFFVWEVSQRQRFDYTSYVQNSAYTLIGVVKGIFYNQTPMRILIDRKRETKLHGFIFVEIFVIEFQLKQNFEALETYI